MKTSLVPIEPEKTQIKYPCVRSFSCNREGQELVVLFQSQYKGVIIHEKLTAYTVGKVADYFDAEYSGWEAFTGPIYFGA